MTPREHFFAVGLLDPHRRIADVVVVSYASGSSSFNRQVLAVVAASQPRAQG